MLIPKHIREMRAEMERKALDLGMISRRTRLNYTTCSKLLNGRLVNPGWLARIKLVIEKSPMPEEAGV